MSTLIAISGLGILCLLLEVLNLRKIVFPVALVLLVCILGMTFSDFLTGKPCWNPDAYNMVHATGYTQLFSMLFIVLTIFVVAMCPRFYKEKQYHLTDFIALKIFLLAGAVAMVSFGNTLIFFIGLEILSVCGYILAASNPKSLASNEAGMKYFVMGAVASGFILFGLALVYGVVGSFDIGAISSVVLAGNPLGIWFIVGFIMISVGMLFKASIAPFHFWAPDVYEGSPTLVTAMMSTLVKVAAIGALFKMVSIMPAGMTRPYQIAIVVLSILSMFIGNITALRQSNVKRLMAYSGIAHAGFMIMALLAVNTSSLVVFYYAAAYSLAGIAAFAIILSVSSDKRDAENIESYRGLGRRNPVLAVILTCALLSMTGIPVFAGFFAKFFIFSRMIEAHYMVLVIFGIINSIISFYYYFRVINIMFSKQNEGVEYPVAIRSKAYVCVGIIALILNIVIGVLPGIIMNVNI